METLVFDIETQNFFTDPEVGWDNFEALKISVVGIYSYAQDKYFCFEEHEVEKIAELFEKSSRVVGFGSNRYDIPVLNAYFRKKGRGLLNIWDKEKIDLLEEIEIISGQRISLNKLAIANLGEGKIRHGSEAIQLYREGRIDELKEYCLSDVKLTKKLYDLYRERKYLFVPDKNGNLVKLFFNQESALNSPSLF